MAHLPLSDHCMLTYHKKAKRTEVNLYSGLKRSMKCPLSFISIKRRSPLGISLPLLFARSFSISYATSLLPQASSYLGLVGKNCNKLKIR